MDVPGWYNQLQIQTCKVNCEYCKLLKIPPLFTHYSMAKVGGGVYSIFQFLPYVCLLRENRSGPKVVPWTDFGYQKQSSLVNNSPSRTKLATKIGPGKHFWQPKVVCQGWSCFPRHMQVMYTKHINRKENMPLASRSELLGIDNHRQDTENILRYEISTQTLAVQYSSISISFQYSAI